MLILSGNLGFSRTIKSKSNQQGGLTRLCRPHMLSSQMNVSENGNGFIPGLSSGKWLFEDGREIPDRVGNDIVGFVLREVAF